MKKTAIGILALAFIGAVIARADFDVGPPETTLGGLGGIADPGTVTDNALVRWDGTGGATVQDSGVTVTDTGATTITQSGTSGHTAYLSFVNDADTSPIIQYDAASSQELLFKSSNNGNTLVIIQASGRVTANGGLITGAGSNFQIDLNAGQKMDVKDLGSNPAAPSNGWHGLYTKADGYYVIDKDSSVFKIQATVSVAADPCGDTTKFPAGTQFYSTAGDGEFCFCNDAGADKKFSNPATDCF